MSRKNKLRKFSEILSFPNVFENYDPSQPKLVSKDFEEITLKSKWQELLFKNENPITLELACGRGEYTLALAKRYPDRNFIGVDVKGARIWKGAKLALDNNLLNIAFLRTRIEQIDLFFSKQEIDEIWITFPDPFPRKSNVNRRLTAPHFLTKYRQILKKGGVLHLKTDATSLFDYSIESVEEFPDAIVEGICTDIYATQLVQQDLDIKTFYERMHLEEGKKIKYLRFSLH